MWTMQLLRQFLLGSAPEPWMPRSSWETDPSRGKIDGLDLLQRLGVGLASLASNLTNWPTMLQPLFGKHCNPRPPKDIGNVAASRTVNSH